MKLFEVEAKCGHVGQHCFTLKTFAVKAESKKEAAAKVRLFPRVKHHQKDAIRSVVEISLERYNELLKLNNDDPFLKCKNIQEQRMWVTDCDIFEEEYYEEEKEEIKKPVYFAKQLLRNPKKFLRNYVKYETRYVI